MTVSIRDLELDGFRGYPTSRKFKFPKVNGGSLLVFAPNGCGKSSLTDAFEFLFNEQGTLERLGVRRGEMNSGRAPLRNTSIAPTADAVVRLGFYDGDRKLKASRRVEFDDPEPLSAELQSLAQRRRVPFVVRGCTLRAFVEGRTPQDHYTFVANAIGADKLAALQGHIRSLQSLLTKAAADKSELKRVSADVKMLTNGAVKD